MVKLVGPVVGCCDHDGTACGSSCGLLWPRWHSLWVQLWAVVTTMVQLVGPVVSCCDHDGTASSEVLTCTATAVKAEPCSAQWQMVSLVLFYGAYISRTPPWQLAAVGTEFCRVLTIVYVTSQLSGLRGSLSIVVYWNMTHYVLDTARSASSGTLLPEEL
jgi:hypothetical protein